MGLRGYIDEDSGNIWVNDGDGMRLKGFLDRESGNIWTHDDGGGDGGARWGCFLALLLLMTFPIWGIVLIAGCQALQEWRQQARPRGQAVPAVIQPDAEPPAAWANREPPAIRDEQPGRFPIGPERRQFSGVTDPQVAVRRATIPNGRGVLHHREIALY